MGGLNLFLSFSNNNNTCCLKLGCRTRRLFSYVIFFTFGWCLDAGKAAQQGNLPVPEGCTDRTAENFDPTARSDDGSCSYAL